jgi:hypothetical protein
MSHANCLNSDAYTDASHDPWRKDHNLLVDVHFLSKSPKFAMNFLRNVSKLFTSDDCHSNNSANQVSAMPNNRLLMSPTWANPFG